MASDLTPPGNFGAGGGIHRCRRFTNSGSFMGGPGGIQRSQGIGRFLELWEGCEGVCAGRFEPGRGSGRLCCDTALLWGLTAGFTSLLGIPPDLVEVVASQKRTFCNTFLLRFASDKAG